MCDPQYHIQTYGRAIIDDPYAILFFYQEETCDTEGPPPFLV